MATSSIELVGTTKSAKAAKEMYSSVTLRRRQASSRLGEEMWHDAARVFGMNTIEGLAAQLSSFWTSGVSGEAAVVHTDASLIEVKTCYDFVGWNIGSSGISCGFETGSIESIFRGCFEAAGSHRGNRVLQATSAGLQLPGKHELAASLWKDAW